MTVNHDVVGSSPTAGVIRHLPKFYLGFFTKRARTIVLALFGVYLLFLDNQVNKKVSRCTDPKKLDNKLLKGFSSVLHRKSFLILS